MRKNGYTQEQLDFIIQNYSILGPKRIGEKLGKSTSVICAKAKSLGLYIDLTKRIRHNPIRKGVFTLKEEDWLRTNYNDLGPKECSKILKKPLKTIKTKAIRLKLKINNKFRKQKKYEQWELDYLKENYHKLGPKRCGEKLNRTNKNIFVKAKQLGLTFANSKEKIPFELNRETDGRTTYTHQDIQWLKENYETLGPTLSAKHLGRHIKSVHPFAQSLGLKYKRRYAINNENKDEIIKLYKNGWSCNKIGKKLNLADETIRDFLVKNRLQTDPTRTGPIHTFYRGTVNKKCPSFGYQGNFKNIHFRSLLELSYMITLDRLNIKWESGEEIRLKIQYEFEGIRSYFPDLIIDDKYLVEIKPTDMQNEPKNLAKFAAARQYCAENSLIFKVIHPPTLKEQIKSNYLAGNVKISPKQEFKFLKYIGLTQKNQTNPSTLLASTNK